MPGTVETADPDEIQDWIEQRGGEPAITHEGSGELRIDFGDEEDLEQISWREFMEILDQERLMLVYEQSAITGTDKSSSTEEYEFVREAGGSPEDLPNTEMDDIDILRNMEETST